MQIIRVEEPSESDNNPSQQTISVGQLSESENCGDGKLSESANYLLLELMNCTISLNIQTILIAKPAANQILTFRFKTIQHLKYSHIPIIIHSTNLTGSKAVKFIY